MNSPPSAMLLFRGQYFFGTMPPRCPEGFVTAPVAGGRVLLHHEALPTSVRQHGDLTGILIGLVVDPSNPQWEIGDILADLLNNEFSRIVEKTARLAGRWALVILGKDHEIAVGDACGTLPVVHVRRDGRTWLASSSRLLGFCLDGLQTNELAGGQFRELQIQKRDNGQPFPATMTEFAGVNVLLPNHYLDLESGIARRFHPFAANPRLTVAEAAPRIAEMTKNIVLAVSRRSPVAVPVTAGFDSRVIAGSVSRIPGLVGKTQFFTFEDFGAPAGHFDIENGRKIGEAVGGVHRKIKAGDASEAAQKIFAASESMNARRFENWAAQCLSVPFQGRIVLMGWASEIARAFIRWPGSDDVTVDQIANLAGVNAIPFAHADIERWYADALQVRKACGINLLDLYYWELRVGRWCSSGLNILNSASDWITIYSCRALLDLMLSVEEKDRSGSAQALYRAVVNELDPALMQIPFNPFPLSYRMKQAGILFAKTILVNGTKAVGLYELLRRLRRRLKG